MRRIAMMIAVFAIAMLPVAAVAQSAEVDALQAALDQLAAAETLEEYAAARDAVQAAVDALQAANPDLDTAALADALSSLTAAIDGEDLDEVGGAAVVVNDAGAVVVAAAGDDGTSEPTGVATGSAVYTGPNVALLAVAGVLALLAGATLLVRRRADRE